MFVVCYVFFVRGSSVFFVEVFVLSVFEYLFVCLCVCVCACASVICEGELVVKKMIIRWELRRSGVSLVN